MLTKPADCYGCPLYSIGRGFSAPEGLGSNGVLGVAEALGDNEVIDGLPLRPVGQAGGVLERSFTRIGISRPEFALWNMVACQPPDNKLENTSFEIGAVNHCKTHFDRVLQRYQPRLILAFGNVPIKFLAGYSGKKKSVSFVRGFVLDGVRYQIPVIGTYHPAYIARGKSNLLPVLRHDIKAAIGIARNGWTRKRPQAIARPSREVLEQFYNQARSHPNWLITYDIETKESLLANDESEVKAIGNGRVQFKQGWEEDTNVESGTTEDDLVAEPEGETVKTVIDQIQFAMGPHVAIVMPFVGDYVRWAAAIMALPNPKAGFNNHAFDDPLLREAGFSYGAYPHDAMWQWNAMQPDLPRGLQYFTSFYVPEYEPWKHLSDSSPDHYGACDVTSLHEGIPRLTAAMQERGIYDGYLRHVWGLNQILIRASERGVPANIEAQGVLRETVTKEEASTLELLQQLYPDQLKPVEPKEGYASDKVAQTWMGKTTLEIGERWERRTFKVKDKKTGEIGIAERWCRVQPFKPNSSPQIMAYIKFKGYAVPMSLKTKKETTEKAELRKLGRKHKDPFFYRVVGNGAEIDPIMGYRELRKIRSTYIEGWKLDFAKVPDKPKGLSQEDEAHWRKIGYVHTTFTFAPATGQLSSRAPNVQNVPKHGAIGDAFRSTIEAPPGYKIIELDYKSYHALTLGYNAKSPGYMWIARRDVHSFIAAQMLKIADAGKLVQLLSDRSEELVEVLNWWKKNKTTLFAGKPFKQIRDKQAKPGILGIGFGLGAFKLWKLNEDSFSTQKESQYVIDTVTGHFPEIPIFQTDVRKLASDQGFLLSAHGAIRWFMDVFHWQQVRAGYQPRKGEEVFPGRNGQNFKRVHGDDSEAAVAFLPANDAFGHKKERLLALEYDRRVDELGLLERYGYINDIHDSLMFNCQDRFVEECLHVVKAHMEARSAVLVNSAAPEGLWCEAEASVGQVWVGREKNPRGMATVEVR